MAQASVPSTPEDSPGRRSLRRRSVLAVGLAAGALPALPAAITLGSAARAAEPTLEGALIGPAEPPHLHLMTFNIRYPADAPPHSWPERRLLVAELLRRERPTVVGTQEGFYYQGQDMLEDLGRRYDWIHMGRLGGSRSEATAILYDTERVKPIAYDHLWMSDTPLLIGSATWGNNVVRMLTWVRFSDLRTGKEFVFLNTHFDHQSENSRQRSAEMIVGLLPDFEVPTVVLGDFNSWHDVSVPYQIMLDGGLVDTWDSADRRLTLEYGTFNGWNPDPVDGNPRIDWILTTPDISTSKTGINTWSKRGLTPSDHWAVQSLITLPD